jgi:hypothetical protein
VPPHAPLRDNSSKINEAFFKDLMKRFNEFLVHKGHSMLETPNVLRPAQPPMSIKSVDRNGVEVVHDMELVAQYNALENETGIQELYSEFIENIHDLFADFIQFYHSDFLEEYGGMIIRADGEPYFEVELPKRVFADIWANGTSDKFQHKSKYFLFGIIVRDFKITDKDLSEALLKRFLEDQKDEALV